jgi:hypothetical protein
MPSISLSIVKVPHVEVRIPVPIQRQHFLGLFYRHPMDTPFAPPMVEQSAISTLLISLPHALHIAHAHPGDLGCLDPRQLPRHRFQYYVL